LTLNFINLPILLKPSSWPYFICSTLLLLMLFCQQYCVAQAPPIQFEKSFGGSDNDEGERIIQTNDGGYILLGWSYSQDGDIGNQVAGYSVNCWIAKMDAVGNISWKKTIGGTKWDAGLDIKQTKDGGYIVAGHTHSNDGDMSLLAFGASDALIFKLDASGNIQWLKTYGGSQEDAFRSIEETSDGGYIAAGYTGSDDHDVSGLQKDYDAWIVKVDGAGKIQWQRCVGGINRDVAWSVKPTPDGCYAFTGYNGGSVNGDIYDPLAQPDLSVGKLDAQGNLLWQKFYGGSKYEWGWNLIVTNDGNLVVAGYNTSADGDPIAYYGGTDIWILKLDEQGNLLWQKVFGGYNYENPYSLTQTSDGGFIIGAQTSSKNGDVSVNHGGVDYWLLKLDVKGSLQWEKTLGGSAQDVCHDVIPTTDGGYMAVGTTYSNDGEVSVNKGKTDIWLVKLGDCHVNTPALPTINAGTAAPCAGTTMTYAVTPVIDATGYTWSVPEGWTIRSGQGTPAITVQVGNNAGDVSVLAFNTCKYSQKQILQCKPVIVPAPKLTISAGQAGGICKGVPMVFTALPVNATAPAYQWLKNGIKVGTNASQYTDNFLSNNDLITCEMTSFSTCGDPVTILSQEIKVSVIEPVTPAITISNDLNNICQGAAIHFTATTQNGGSQPQYTWFINDIATGNNGPSFTSQTIADRDVISCSFMTSETCVTSPVAVSNPISIAVNPNLTPELSIRATATTICKNDRVTFSATALNAGTEPVYTWRINSTITGTNDPIYTTQELSDQDKISCTIVPGKNTCATTPITSNTITITINELPQITLSPTDTIVTPGTQVILNTAISQDIRSFQWTPESMLINPSSIEPTTVPILQAVTYRLSILSKDGCPVFKDLTIKPKYPFNLPNAFTPNGDGKNDLFRIPPFVDFDLTELIIYNRFGQIVFSTRDIKAGWDGRFRGKEQPSGEYVYQISGVLNQKKVALKGMLTLAR
jgi:gliding motility-associated-like protein